MAGRNQHHIPQSVLKGFARDPNENPQRVWEYRRGAPVAPRPTHEVAAQRDFYSKPAPAGEASLDDRITTYEGERFAPLLKRLRSVQAPGPVEHDDAAEYIGHLIPRGDHMRRFFGETMARFLGDAHSFIGDPDKIRAHLGFDDLEPEGVALEEIRKLIVKTGAAQLLVLAEIPEKPVERLGFAVLREYAEPALSHASAKAAKEFAEMSIDVKGRVRQAHTDALERIGEAHRMKGLEDFVFSIEETTAELLLPDCVAVALDESGLASPFTMLKRAETAMILAPMAPHRVLVGRRDPNALIPDDADLAPKLAACAHMFFVAASDNFRDLHEKLGSVSETELSRIIDGVFERPRKLLPSEQQASAEARPFTLTTPSGFTDVETNELGQFIADVAGDVHATMALGCLERVTIQEGGALNDSGLYLVDQGAMDGELVEGRLRLWIYLPRALGETLVRDSADTDFRLSLLVLISALTRVAAASQLDALSPEYFRDLGTDTNAAMHHRGMVWALPAYAALAALRVANEEPRFDELMDEAAANALAKADQHMAAGKATFTTDGNADAFARVAGECVMMTTNASAAVAGRGAGSLAAFPKFAAALMERALTNWFARFSRDLAAFWDEPRSVANPRAWGLHSERLMMRWGVMTWAVEGNRFMIRVFPEAFVEAADKAMKGLASQLDQTKA